MDERDELRERHERYDREIQAEQIANILSQDCPCFRRDESIGSLVSDQCHCSGLDGPCECVLMLKTSCPAGHWPGFWATDAQKRMDDETQAYHLNRAHTACEELSNVS